MQITQHMKDPGHTLAKGTRDEICAVVHSVARIFVRTQLRPCHLLRLLLSGRPAGCRWGLRLPFRSSPVRGDPHWIGKLLQSHSSSWEWG